MDKVANLPARERVVRVEETSALTGHSQCMYRLNLGSHEEFVRELVESGRCESPSHVVRAGLELLAEVERRGAEDRGKITEGMAAARAGLFIDGEEAFARVRAELERRK